MFSSTSKKLLVLAALALCTTAYALDVEIQQGAAVKFPKNLQWKPMAAYDEGASGDKYGKNAMFADVESKEIWEDKTSGTEQELLTAIKIWKPIIAGNEEHYQGYVFKTLPTVGGDYFVSSAYTKFLSPEPSMIGCDPHKPGKNYTNIVCKTILSFTPKGETKSVEVDFGEHCVVSGDVFGASLSGEPDYQTNHPEIAFDKKSSTFYMRQIADGKPVKACNRKITIKH